MKIFNWLLRKKEPKKIKLGLALGSGGAKGFAHLGAIKCFEENGLAFDYIAGTSIGSIVGAFYADGYSSGDIMELLKRVDIGEITNMFMLKMDTSGLFNVIDRTLGELAFEELKIPFKAIATELDTGEEHVFESGNVAKALCASSSIPPFFKPVVIDGVRYIDGAYTNSVPSDVVKGMGADYVIAIDLRTENSKASFLTKIFPSYKGKVEEPWAKGYEYADTMLKPNLEGYSSTSFWQANQMYDIGYKTASDYISKIKNDIELLQKKPKKRKG